MTLTWALVAVVAVAVSALLAIADGALLAATRPEQRRLVGDPERAHRALSLVRMLAHLLTGMAIALAIVDLGAHFATVALTGILVLLVTVALVEGIARESGQRRGLDETLISATRFTNLLFMPVTALGALFERILARALPPRDDTALERTSGAERFREVVTAEADVSEAEEELLHGVFSLRDTDVREIMVPRVNMVGIERTARWSEVVDRVSASEHARFPVYEETLDNVVGILYAKDLLPAIVSGAEPAEWTTLIRSASFIPATKRIDQQLRDFKNDRTHIAVVVDEYGGTAGIVTIEDILEEIVGEIRDEYDEEEPSIEQEEGTRFWVSGTVTLADLSELLGEDFQREDLTTVGGLMYDAFGRVPRPGESRIIGSFKVVVERVRRRRVERVFFERLAPALEKAERE
jgi:CBS domain containing-hemolysin-like protein